MINILIRTHERPAMFKRCIESIMDQAFPGYPTSLSIFVTADTDRSFEYAKKTLTGCGINHIVIKVTPPPVPNRSQWFYNLYCNDLIHAAKNLTDWLLFLDDDDYLIPGSLNKVVTQLERLDANGDQALICQFIRNNKAKPSNVMIDKREVRSGYIGLPCIFVNGSIAEANFTDSENADYQWIKQYEDSAEFVKIPVVFSERRNHGRSE